MVLLMHSATYQIILARPLSSSGVQGGPLACDKADGLDKIEAPFSRRWIGAVGENPTRANNFRTRRGK